MAEITAQQKQISFPRPLTRLFSIMLDVFLLSIVLTPISNFFSVWVFRHQFAEYFTEHNITQTTYAGINEIAQSREFMEYVMQKNFVNELFKYWLYISTPQILFLGIIFIFLWVRFGTTPGKIITRSQIVDRNTLEKPKLKQSLKRFFFSLFYIIGVWFMLFDKERRTLHDRMANTLVIKK